MVDATSDRVDLVRYLVDVDRGQFVPEAAKAELAELAAPAREESANVVKESGVFGSAFNLRYIRLEISIKIDWLRLKDYRVDSDAALAVVVGAPGKAVTIPAKDDSVSVATFHVTRFSARQAADQSLDEHGAILLLSVRVINAELAADIRSHGVH